VDSGRTDARWTWHLALWAAPVAMGVVFLAVMVTLAGGFEPFLFIFGAVLLAAGFVGRRFPRRAGPITVLVVLVLMVLMNAPSLVDDLGHPESFLNFAVFGVVLLGLALTGIIASIAQLARRSDGGAAKLVYGAMAVIALGIVGSAVATLTLEDDLAEPGDVRIVAEDFEFAPTQVSGSGTVGILIENEDPGRHTFAIDELDLEVELPANTARRVEVTAPPGTYEFHCQIAGHENMKGTVTISG
jgi:plastocyanin